MNTLTRKRTHFPRTTASQRELLFHVWQTTGDVQLACRKAHVCEGTFYKWKPRFESRGYEALKQLASHAPKTPHRTPQAVEQKVIDRSLRHPKWGKRRIADEITKANNWVPLVSPNTVRRILIDAGLWVQIQIESQQNKPAQARTADKPAQTVNIDLCFVPATHETDEVVSKLPAVSGSSGRLVVERTLEQAAKSEPTWPGRIFEDQNLTYEEAMAGFVTASANKSEPTETSKSPEAAAAAAVLEKKRQIRQEEEALRAQRRTVRQRRALFDQAWSAIRDQRRAQKAGSPAVPVERQPDLIEQQPDLIEQQPDQIEQQPDQIEQQPDSIAQQADLLKRQTLAVSQQADSITQQTQPMAKASGQGQSVDVQTTLMAISPSPSVSLPPQARPTVLTERSVALVDPVSLATERVVITAQQAASLSSLVLAVQSAPSQTTEAPQQATEAPQQATEPQQTTEVPQQTTEVPQQTTEAPQHATSVAQQATLAMRQITIRGAAEVIRPETEVMRPQTEVMRPQTEVIQSVAKEEAAEASQEHISNSQWHQIKSARKAQKEQRQKEDVQWRQERNSILQRLGELPLITAWLAILVIVDNCTRQCISLPLFMVGPHVTAQMIVYALKEVLPAELQYLISDRGIHFRANVFAQFCQMGGFQHVLIAKHRPQSNGIAERFVRTLKEWLADKSWTSEEELIALLTEFREYYNDRPHQGIAMPGLSPNEYAKRIWLQ